MKNHNLQKTGVRDFWENAACGEEAYLSSKTKEDFAIQAEERYRLEPYILPFANFSSWRGKRVLEIGVGLGADHQKFAEAGAELTGIDLTNRAITLTATRFKSLRLHSSLGVGDAENLIFPDGYFDLVYSWGVIHHSPNTGRAAQEILRVLRPGGKFRVMIYHKWSMVGIMLWLRYALFSGRPFRSLSKVYSKHLESPGTKAYTREQALNLFVGAENLKITTVLTHGDLLESKAGQKHQGILLDIARKIWPRWIIRKLLYKFGLFMLISGSKPEPSDR